MFSSIHRLTFASMPLILIALAGCMAHDPVAIEVSTSYPGADARTVAENVAAPIFQQVNGVEDMLDISEYINDGSYRMIITFKPRMDPDMAQDLVQKRVDMALPILPSLVQKQGITVKKKLDAVQKTAVILKRNGYEISETTGKDTVKKACITEP